MSYKVHTNCRACGWGPQVDPGYIKSNPKNDRLESVLNLGVLPLPNAFAMSGESRPGYYPVELMVCPRCHLGQLSAVVDPLVMYAQYPYVTSTSRMMDEHLTGLFEQLTAIHPKGKIESVVEIGSNDGLCLEKFRNLGATAVMGVDPAQNLVETAKRRGVNSLCSLFDRQAAEMASASMPPIDLVLARHVFCHVDDWQSFVNNLAVLCSANTLVCIEVPYAQDMIDRCEWDTVYAEHLSYLTIKSVQALLHGSALRIYKVLRFKIHGGAIGLVLRRRDQQEENDKTLLEMIEQERCGLSYWHAFAAKARDQITALKLLVQQLKADRKRIIGYGASAKSSMWINACGFTRREIDFIADCTKEKWYRTSPGNNIPILDEGALTRELPDYAICFSWNFREEIIAKERIFRESGGKWIFPVPAIEIV